MRSGSGGVADAGVQPSSVHQVAGEALPEGGQHLSWDLLHLEDRATQRSGDGPIGRGTGRSKHVTVEMNLIDLNNRKEASRWRTEMQQRLGRCLDCNPSCPLTSCVSLGKVLTLSVLHCLRL